MHSSPLSKQLNTRNNFSDFQNWNMSIFCDLYLFHIDRLNSQEGRNIGNLVSCRDHFDMYHIHMDFSLHKYPLELYKLIELLRFRMKLTLFTVWSFETATTLTGIGATTWIDTNATILTWLASTRILIFTSLTSEIWKTLTCKATISIWYTLTTIHTWIWCATIS